MTSSSVSRAAAAMLLCTFAAPVVAGPGFIDTARVAGTPSATHVEIRFNCKAEYLRHEPQSAGDRLRIYLEPTGICNGVSPVVAETRSRMRPFNADRAHLVDVEYDGDAATGPVLTLNFSEAVVFDVDMAAVAFGLNVELRPEAKTTDGQTANSRVSHRQVQRPEPAPTDYAINLASLQRVPTMADAGGYEPGPGRQLYYYEVIVDGTKWYRLRLGDFASADAVSSTFQNVKNRFPGAWIDEVGDHDEVVLTEEPAKAASTPDSATLSKVDALMEEARLALVAGEVSRAVQIYTKIMQLPEHPRQPEAQEYLALAREKKGQTAHAKAEYERYLSLYPDNDGAARVKQRLTALIAADSRQIDNGKTAPSNTAVLRSRQSDWQLRTYFSQYYRRDANQQNDEDEVISQSALYSDINLDARRRGERFDFSSRLSAGYRNDFLGENEGSGDQLRVSYAYLDLADAALGLRGRLGRQTRNTGGVLGRFDGFNLAYDLGERMLINGVVGKPAYSSTNGIDSARTFYGASLGYRPALDDLELGLYFIEQNIESMDDRQAVGAEFRYFGTDQSLWGLVDYDTLYNELGSAFLQGSWRLSSRLTLHGSADRRHSPYLSTGNALIGQPVFEFGQLIELLPADEIRKLGLDRSPVSTTYSLGVSHSLTPRLQINADLNDTTVDATPASGGVPATPATSYRYYSTNFVASSLLREGDVTIFGLRYSDSDNASVTSLTLDSRYPLGRTWRINPRLRIDRRERVADSSDEWLYSPGIRVQYRRGQKLRILFEAGKQFSERETETLDLDRESYYLNLGYQVFF